MLGSHERIAAVLEVIDRVLAEIERKSEKDQTLFYADCGILALYANGIPTAKKSLDQSLSAFETITVGGQTEKEASSLKGRESAKLFKGEPYERALVYFHRGLLFFSEGDYENAHACFLNASAQTTAGQAQAECRNWMAVDAMLLLCKKAMGSDSGEEFSQLCISRYSDRASEWAALTGGSYSQPVVLLIGAGIGPMKVTERAREGGPALSYRQVPTKIATIRLSSNGDREMILADDVCSQATGRGSRPMDVLLARKAQASEQTDKSGSVAATIGILGGQFIPGLSLLGAAIQEAAMKDSSNIDASADLRQLSSVPGRVYLAVIDRKSLSDAIHVEVLDANGTLIGNANVTIGAATRERPLIIVGRMPF